VNNIISFALNHIHYWKRSWVSFKLPRPLQRDYVTDS